MVKRISIQEAEALCSAGNSVVVDIRDELSYMAGHIPGAIHIDNDNISAFIERTDKNLPVLVCCYHGNASQQAAAFLVTQGFEQACSIDGGFEAWKTCCDIERSDS